MTKDVDHGEDAQRISTLAMVKDPRLARLFACVGLLLEDGGVDGDVQDAMNNLMLDLAPEFVPPYCNEPEDWQAWRDLIDSHASGLRYDDVST